MKKSKLIKTPPLMSLASIILHLSPLIFQKSNSHNRLKNLNHLWGHSYKLKPNSSALISTSEYRLSVKDYIFPAFFLL